MFQSKSKFLATKHTNALDQLAQRALVLDVEFAKLHGNAYDLGHDGGKEACQRARSICLTIFALAHRERRYAFAEDVSKNIEAISASFPAVDAFEEAGTLLAAAEFALDLLTRELPAVCTVHCKGVQILRGSNVSAAMRSATAVNDNPRPGA